MRTFASGHIAGVPHPRGPAARLVRIAERTLDGAFSPEANPLRQLGALSFHCFWIVAASGAYLYVFFDTSVTGAYDSVRAMTHEQPWTGGVMRSLHRYASDALVVITGLHVLREAAHGRFRGFRWFSWVSGVPLAWLALAAGVTGYWLVWDDLALFVAIGTTEWFAALPGFGPGLVRNFLTASALSDRLFSLLVFLHIGIPLLLLLGMWIHIQRITRARTRPAPALGHGFLAALVVLCIAHPAVSQAMADLGRAAPAVPLDWFYLAGYPLLYELSPTGLWLVAGAATAALAVLPWVRAPRRPPAARVDLSKCNGCGRCFADCPYAAVVMMPRTDDRPHPRQAVVLADLCASCGICAGACPSSTPFQRTDELASGIDLPQLTVRDLRERLERGMAQDAAAPRVVVFGCVCAADVRALEGSGVTALALPCTGMLPPSFVEYALRTGADGVLVTGCPPDDCEYRFGTRWTAERFAREREPQLRASVQADTLRVRWVATEDARMLYETLAGFRAELARAPVHAHARVARAGRVEGGLHG